MFICNNKPLLFNSILYKHFPKSSFFFLVVLGLHCCEWAFSSCSLSYNAWRLAVRTSLVAEQKLWVHGLQWLQHIGLAAVAHGLSFSAAWGILPDRGSNLLDALLWEVDSYPLYHKGSPFPNLKSLSTVSLNGILFPNKDIIYTINPLILVSVF